MFNPVFKGGLEETAYGIRAGRTEVVVKPGCLDELPAVLARSETERQFLKSSPLRHGYLPGGRCALITDSNVAGLYGNQLIQAMHKAGLDAGLFVFTAGEHSKDVETASLLINEMESEGYGRESIIIAMGGGVAGDLAGYVAATFKRGVDYIQVPTTLLAMVDSSLGGKVGVNTQHGKNLIGAFHHPAHVFADLSTLETLPDREYRSGLAEVVKYGALDSVFLEGLERSLDALLAKDMGKLQTTVLAALTIKAHIVNLDPRDVGERRILNFGHTIGQAVEAASTYELSHGEAISIGMVCEGKYCVAVGDWKQEELDRMTQLLQTIGLPTSVPQNLSVDAVVEAARHDKKRAGAVRIIAPESFGSLYYQGCRIAEVGEDELIALLSTQAPNGYIAGKWNSIRSAPRSW